MIAAALLCLSLNVFHEARGEMITGQYAVAQVTMNRAKGDPKKVCKEVYKPKQFSWTHQDNAKVSPARIDPEAWRKAQIVAAVTLTQPLAMDFTKGATHFHTRSVRPNWSRAGQRTARIGHHIFYILK